jgi:hypothetical protein
MPAKAGIQNFARATENIVESKTRAEKPGKRRAPSAIFSRNQHRLSRQTPKAKSWRITLRSSALLLASC